MTTACQRQGCTSPALYAVKINVPARGWPIEWHEPLSAILGLKLCHWHLKQFDLAPFVGKAAVPPMSLRPNFEAVARMRGDGAPAPDFKRAFVTGVRLDSDEYRQFEARAAGGGRGGGSDVPDPTAAA